MNFKAALEALDEAARDIERQRCFKVVADVIKCWPYELDGHPSNRDKLIAEIEAALSAPPVKTD